MAAFGMFGMMSLLMGAAFLLLAERTLTLPAVEARRVFMVQAHFRSAPPSKAEQPEMKKILAQESDFLIPEEPEPVVEKQPEPQAVKQAEARGKTRPEAESKKSPPARTEDGAGASRTTCEGGGKNFRRFRRNGCFRACRGRYGKG